jgi:hypothetical protein
MQRCEQRQKYTEQINKVTLSILYVKKYNRVSAVVMTKIENLFQPDRFVSLQGKLLTNSDSFLEFFV